MIGQWAILKPPREVSFNAASGVSVFTHTKQVRLLIHPFLALEIIKTDLSNSNGIKPLYRSLIERAE